MSRTSVSAITRKLQESSLNSQTAAAVATAPPQHWQTHDSLAGRMREEETGTGEGAGRRQAQLCLSGRGDTMDVEVHPMTPPRSATDSPSLAAVMLSPSSSGAPSRRASSEHEQEQEQRCHHDPSRACSSASSAAAAAAAAAAAGHLLSPSPQLQSDWPAPALPTPTASPSLFATEYQEHADACVTMSASDSAAAPWHSHSHPFATFSAGSLQSHPHHHHPISHDDYMSLRERRQGLSLLQCSTATVPETLRLAHAIERAAAAEQLDSDAADVHPSSLGDYHHHHSSAAFSHRQSRAYRDDDDDENDDEAVYDDAIAVDSPPSPPLSSRRSSSSSGCMMAQGFSHALASPPPPPPPTSEPRQWRHQHPSTTRGGTLGGRVGKTRTRKPAPCVPLNRARDRRGVAGLRRRSLVLAAISAAAAAAAAAGTSAEGHAAPAELALLLNEAGAREAGHGLGITCLRD
ncbi:hypothetical protein KEM52_005459 [Ascosphaera acerosa]|nr:hypothetical protein KEM52_005459 [Ascosphaera acerosa]